MKQKFIVIHFGTDYFYRDRYHTQEQLIAEMETLKTPFLTSGWREKDIQFFYSRPKKGYLQATLVRP